MEFLNAPFVPQGKVLKVIISFDCSDNIITELQKNNIEVIKTLKNKNLKESMSGHADLQINIVDDIAVVADFCFEHYKNMLPEFNVVKGVKEVQDTYPLDVSYNISAVNNCLYHNLKYTDSKLLEIYKNKGYRIQNVKQGYTKCTSCIVSENAVITEDIGLARIYKANDVDVLVVEPGDVKLNGFNYGFLGGASGLISNDTLAFCGNIKKHRNYKEIYSFTQKHKVDIISLSDEQLTDYGSIIPVHL